MKIVQAQSEHEIQQVRELFAEYVAWLGINLCFQNYEKELAELPGDYVQPGGRLLLVLDEDGRAAGCAALRDLGKGVCEMKRLFVRPEFRGQHLGERLVDMILNDARAIGYQCIRLDTLPGKMDRAIAMYRARGFKDIAAYYNNPVVGAAFMELELQ
jgi:putative acetyltransferase